MGGTYLESGSRFLFIFYFKA